MLVLNAHIGEVRSLSFASDGVHLASAGGAGNRVALWHLTERERNHNGKRGQGRVHRVIFAPRGPALVAHSDKIIRFWANPFSKTAPEASWKRGHCAFHPDGAELAYIHSEQRDRFEIEFRSTKDGSANRETVLVPRPHGAGILAWTPAGLLLARTIFDGVLNRYQLEVIQVDAGVTINYLPITAYPHYFAISPDGRTLVGAGTVDTTIQRWDLGTGQPLPPLTGHDQVSVALAYLPDGRLISCAANSIVRTWDPESGRCLDVKDWRMNDITALAVAPDGMRAAVGNRLGNILIWDLD